MKTHALLGALLLATATSGCATIQKLESLAGASVSPTQVIVAANSFDAIESTAANYLRLPLCPQAAACKSDAGVKAIVPAIRAARKARSQLEAYVNANPGQPAPVSLYTALTTAVSALQSAVAIYNVK